MQLVGYEPGTPTDPATLLLAEGGVVESRSLEPGTALTYGLKESHCAGSIEGSSHTRCTRPGTPYCDRHRTIWPCARCRGECTMPVDSCQEEHAIYLAAFEPATFKVGVTRQWRLETRLAEQGAKRGIHIRTVENGRKARQIEAEMAQEIADRVDIGQKIEALDRELDIESWNHFVEPYSIHQRFEFDYGISVAQQPINATKASGAVRGSRGRILVLEDGSTPYAVDLKSLVGYEIQAGKEDTDRQSSLGAF